MTRFKAACVQMRSGTDMAENIAEATRLIEAAHTQGAQLIATPEMTTLLEKSAAALFANAGTMETDPAIPAFTALAKRLSCWLAIGSVPIILGDGKRKILSYMLDQRSLVFRMSR